MNNKTSLIFKNCRKKIRSIRKAYHDAEREKEDDKTDVSRKF